MVDVNRRLARVVARQGREPKLAELQALADHATQRLALYRRKILLGRGEPRRLAELERTAKGAADRLRRGRQPAREE